MAVASRGAALSAFRELIDHDPIEARNILRRPYLPDGLEPSEDAVGMDRSASRRRMARHQVRCSGCASTPARTLRRVP